MPSACRKTDIQLGTCTQPCNGGGSITQNGENDKSYSPNVLINTLPASRKTDKGSTKCPCLGIYEITTGSSNVFVNMLPSVRLSDSTLCDNCSGEGSIMSGSSNVIIN